MKTNRRPCITSGLSAFAISVMVMGLSSLSIASSTGQQSTKSIQTLANSDLLLLGPVERVDPANMQIHVLGQVAAIPASSQALKINGLGKMVAVYGSLNINGSLKVREIQELNANYVPGATQLYVKGIVTSVDYQNADARVGSLTVSYSGSLHTLVADALVPGAVVSFSGVEFDTSTKFYADNGLIVAKPLGQTGSDGQTERQVRQDCRKAAWADWQ